MGLPVNTVAAGGLPVVDVTATTPKAGMPVSEAAPGMGVAVTKVAALGVPVTFETIGAGGGTLSAPLDTVAGVTGAWSFSRNMLTSFGAGTRYTKTGSAIQTLEDQSGSNRDFVTGGNPPNEATAFPTNVLCADFDGVNDALVGPAVSALIGASSGALVVSVILDTVAVNTGTVYLNHAVFGDLGQYMGLFARNLSGVTFYAYNYDGTVDAPSTTGATGTPYVMMWRHHGGNIYLSINGGTEVTVASGNTSDISPTLYMGGASTIGTVCDCKIAEMFTTSDGSQTAALAAAIANMKTYVGA